MRMTRILGKLLAVVFMLSFILGSTPNAPSAQTPSFVEGNTAFALELYGQLKTDPGNLFFSPYSIHEKAPAQHATINASDPVPDVALRADADAVIRIDERDVLNSIVVALQMEGPGVWDDVGGLLLRIPHRQTAHGGRMAHLKERRPVLLDPPTRGQPAMQTKTAGVGAVMAARHVGPV